MGLGGHCVVAAAPAEPQLSQCSPSWERMGPGMGGRSYSPVLGRGGRAVQPLVMLWTRGAAAEGTPTGQSRGVRSAHGPQAPPEPGEGGKSSSPPLNLCAFLRKNPAGSCRAKACECHPVSAARGPRGSAAWPGDGTGGTRTMRSPRVPTVSPQNAANQRANPSLGCPQRCSSHHRGIGAAPEGAAGGCARPRAWHRPAPKAPQPTTSSHG